MPRHCARRISLHASSSKAAPGAAAGAGGPAGAAALEATKEKDPAAKPLLLQHPSSSSWLPLRQAMSNK